MINFEHSQDLAILRLYAGKVVDSIRYTLYLFNGISDKQNIGFLEIKFKDHDYLTLDTKGDGQSVRASAERKSLPESFDLNQNAHCEWRFAEITEFDVHAEFRGVALSSVEAIISSLNGLPEFISGWILKFENGNFLVYSNFGDEGLLSVNQFPAPEIGVNSRQEIVV